MLKVLHISGARSWGGNEQQLVDLIYELNLQNVENLVLGVGGSPLDNACKQNNIKFISVKKNKLNKFVNYKYLKRIAQEIKPDILHLHTSDSLTTFVISDMLYKLKTPTVFSKKGMGRSSSFLSKFKYNYPKLSAIICVSEKVKTEFSEILSSKNQKKLSVIYDGISLSRIKEAKKSILPKTEGFFIGHIGNHVRAKDLPTLINMVNVLINELGVKNVHLIQMGEFKDEITREVKKMVDQFKLNEHIHFTGFLSDASSYLGEFDVYVMSSEREGLPLTIYEAFYKKVPVVSTKAGGIPELISDGENGYLAEVGDYKNLALKTKELLHNQEKRKSFSESAYSHFVNNYTSEKCAQNTLKLYKKLIS